MKKFSMCLIMMVMLLSTTVALPQSVSINKNGSRDMITPGISVDVNTNGQRLYLGCTRIIDADVYLKEKDFTKGVSRKVKGSFNKKFWLDSYDIQVIVQNRYRVTWIVALWKTKVKNCGCAWCNKHGFHLEDRIARDTWSTMY